jgi:hypothetical protein
MVTGYVRFSDPAFDGSGLYYDTDSGEILIITVSFGNPAPSMELKFPDYLNVHSRLKFTYGGEKGCLFRMGAVALYK